MNHLYQKTVQNLVLLLQHHNVKVDFNENQTCCGLPFLNKGDQASAKAVAEKFLTDFQTGRHGHHTIIPSTQCAVMVKDYYPKIFNNTVSHLLCNKVVESTRDLFSYLDEITLKLDFSKVTGTYFMLSSCMCNKQNIEETVSKFTNINWIRPEFSDACCGAGNALPVNAPDISENLTQSIIDEALSTGASVIVVTDDICRARIDDFVKRKNISISTLHLIDILAEAI
ncbi:MAG: (Fe-S)-binding protein [Bacteroidia bacterium]|nr:(Fe-S)-binding protein [Bacteroidia bacterium]